MTRAAIIIQGSTLLAIPLHSCEKMGHWTASISKSRPISATRINHQFRGVLLAIPPIIAKIIRYVRAWYSTRGEEARPLTGRYILSSLFWAFSIFFNFRFNFQAVLTFERGEVVASRIRPFFLAICIEIRTTVDGALNGASGSMWVWERGGGIREAKRRVCWHTAFVRFRSRQSSTRRVGGEISRAFSSTGAYWFVLFLVRDIGKW